MNKIKVYTSSDESIRCLERYPEQLSDIRFGPSVSRYWCKSYLENYSRTEQVLFFEYCSADGSSNCLFPGRDVGNGEVRLLFKETADYQDIFSVSGPQEGLSKIILSIFSAGFQKITLDKLHHESPTVRTVMALEGVDGIHVSRHECDRMPIVRIQRNSDVRLWDDMNRAQYVHIGTNCKGFRARQMLSSGLLPISRNLLHFWTGCLRCILSDGNKR